jgi:putative transposase
MSRKYKIHDQQKLHIVTFTVIHWIDVFTRDNYRTIFIDSLKYCQANKGLEVYAYVIMTNHVHLIIGTSGENVLEGIIRDLKAFTSRSIRKALEDTELPESRREWMLRMMYRAGKYNSNNIDYQFWQQYSHPIELSSNRFLDQKLEYIHMNPVKAGFVDEPEAWVYSSARDYAGVSKGPVDVIII